MKVHMPSFYHNFLFNSRLSRNIRKLSKKYKWKGKNLQETETITIEIEELITLFMGENILERDQGLEIGDL